MAVKFQVVPLTVAQLEAIAKPTSVGAPEAIPFTFFDQQNLVTGWTNVTYFAAPQNDPTLGNIQQANTLSAEQYFRLYAITFDFIIAATSSASSGAPQIIDDLLGILNSSRALVNMTIAMKTYIQTPLHSFHSSGGIQVCYSQGVPQASGLGNYAQNWWPDGGYNIGGSIVLPPKQTFSFTLQGAAGANALNATRGGRFTMFGTLHRPVR